MKSGSSNNLNHQKNGCWNRITLNVYNAKNALVLTILKGVKVHSQQSIYEKGVIGNKLHPEIFSGILFFELINMPAGNKTSNKQVNMYAASFFWTKAANIFSANLKAE